MRFRTLQTSSTKNFRFCYLAKRSYPQAFKPCLKGKLIFYKKCLQFIKIHIL